LIASESARGAERSIDLNTRSRTRDSRFQRTQREDTEPIRPLSDGRAMDDDALMAMLPPDCDRQAWRKCFEDCRTMQTHPDSLKGRVACGGSEQAPG